MREAIYKDAEGRKFKVLLPDDSGDDEAEYGIPIGPPDLSELGLPLSIEVKLNNQLFARGLFKKEDLKKRRQDLLGALQSALSIDANKIEALY